MRIRHKALGTAIAILTFALATGCGSVANNTTSGQTNTTSNATSNSTSHQINTSIFDPSQLQTTKQRWSSPPKMTIDTSKQYDAIVHTNYGDFTIHLLPKQSPKTVNNFVFLADHHFYKNNAFFRIIQSFMIQTGTPNNDGTGGPGYQFADELPPKEKYQPGIVAMANSGPNTNGSQFFICTGPQSRGLQPKYTIFGQITSGMDVVNAIAAIPVVMNPRGTEKSYPTKTAYIKSIDIKVH